MAIAADTAHFLARKLRDRVAGEVRFDPGARALYATDASNYREVPIGVVVPRSLDDVVETVALCREFGAPVLPRGGGTSLAGQCCNTAVVIDFTKWCNRILEVDPEASTALVEPGCVLDRLRDAAAEHDLTFGPDPATHAHNTLGGMIGNNSCGVHSVMAGRTADNVLALEVLTYDGARFWVGDTGDRADDEIDRHLGDRGRKGEICRGLAALRERYADEVRARFPRIPRRVSGYNLDELLRDRRPGGANLARALVGTEGTCAIVLRARLRLVPRPRCRTLVVLGFPDVVAAARAVPDVLDTRPIGLEGMDRELIAFMHAKHLHPGAIERLPDGDGWLLVEFGGAQQLDSHRRAERLVARLERSGAPPSIRVLDDADEQARLWQVREAGLGATAHVKHVDDTHEGWEDAAVPPERLGDYLAQFRALLDRYGYRTSLYGHFGDGCVHCRIDFDLRTEAGIAHWKRFLEDAADLVLAHGGSLSGEHGDGRARAFLLPKMFGPALMEAFRAFKALWDPLNRMNPGKIIDAGPVDRHLRDGPEVQLPRIASAFDYPDSDHRFADATRRCVGVGACRNMDGGVMCPSYRATGDERHSTRGRARLLYEMLRGDPLIDGWRSEAVRDALHLCLACKGCRTDCPVNVDMATYKAEFMARHYEGRLRPRDAYSMGLVFWWARLASQVPGVANALTHATGLSSAAKWLGGIAQPRELPRFADPTFKRWFARRGGAQGPGRPVVLWADTFGNYLHTAPLQAAVDVLETLGWAPIVVQKSICCSRPLYAEGMLDLARRQWRTTLDALGPHIDARVPVVGTEPSCIASFRDELPHLFPRDGRAHYLAAHTFMLGEFLDREGVELPSLDAEAFVHPHCHQYAVMGLEAERRVLARLGLEAAFSHAGCCGMAGSFGFSRDRFDVSMRIGEHLLLPKVRALDDDTLLVANGFSCREQIRQSTGRLPLDLAQVVQRALHGAQTRH